MGQSAIKAIDVDVVGQAIRIANADTDQTVASHAFQMPLPEQVVLTEDLRRAPHRSSDCCIREVIRDAILAALRLFRTESRTYMKCICCDDEARAVCQFCGRAVCEKHIQEKSFVSGFTPMMGFWKMGDHAVKVDDAVWCGKCHPEYQSTG